MTLKDSATPGKILIDCQTCEKLFEVDDFRSDTFADFVRRSYETERRCPDCAEKLAAQKRETERRINREKRLTAACIPPLYIHDRETGKLFTVPPVPFAEKWIYENGTKNLLISGITGSGKSTSACFAAARLIADGKRVRYTNLRKLLSDWREAKTSDEYMAAEKLLDEIFSFDVFIIDEVVGKARVSESGQELLFEILESVNSGIARGIWLLGNFYAGSIEEIFSDPEPVRRRLQENFLCVLLDKENQKIKPLTVWKEK